MNKLVSVIIPTYGGGEFLERAVDSVLAQTYNYIEIIVVDDNGLETDAQKATAKHMEKYVDNNKVNYICHETNRNGAAARNTGVANSSGEYIALLDDDDIYLPDNIGNQVATLSMLSNEYALTYCSNETYLGDNKQRECHVTKSGFVFYEVLLHKVTIGSSSLLIKREAWDELHGFDESFRRHQDWEFTARVCSKYKVMAIDKIGFRRYLEFRNSPKSVDETKKYRIHYLNKMTPYMASLKNAQKRKVIVYNRLDVSIQYLKEKDCSSFWKDVKSIRPGFLLITFFCERLVTHIKRVSTKEK